MTVSINDTTKALLVCNVNILLVTTYTVRFDTGGRVYQTVKTYPTKSQIKINIIHYFGYYPINKC